MSCNFLLNKNVFKWNKYKTYKAIQPSTAYYVREWFYFELKNVISYSLLN